MLKSNRNLAIVLTALTGLASSVAIAASNGPAPGGRNLPVNTALPNTGSGLCSAAINSDGTIAGGFLINPAKTSRISAGNYQVGFFAICNDVRAQRGFMRVVQPDTLTSGSLAMRSCTVADRSGEPSAVFVICFDQTGTAADTSFTLQVTR